MDSPGSRPISRALLAVLPKVLGLLAPRNGQEDDVPPRQGFLELLLEYEISLRFGLGLIHVRLGGT